MRFILNDENISTDQPPGTTVLDFVRYIKNLKGTKIGCREGDCGACTVLVGELVGDRVEYRTMTSCLMPLANAAGKHIVTVEGINPPDRKLTPVQQAMVDESGTQCGFCTVGFVMSLTGFCLDETPKTEEMAVSSIDGNICRCTGYKSIERAAEKVAALLSEPPAPLLPEEGWPKAGVVGAAGGQFETNRHKLVPTYFSEIGARLKPMPPADAEDTGRPLTQAVPTASTVVGGGTDVYVQKPEEMAVSVSRPLLYEEQLRGIRDTGEHIEIGASATVTDLLESSVMQSIFPNLYKHLKLVSSTPIRNMATLAGNFVNASPIGDMTVWFLALDAEITLGPQAPLPASPRSGENSCIIPLRDLYLGYKRLAKEPDEIITAIRFAKPTGDFHFNFEKVSKRTYLDIATVNTAISFSSSPPYEGGVAEGRGGSLRVIEQAHVSAGGVAPIPLYLEETSAFLSGREISEETITAANEIIQSEISPISDVRGSADYKRLLLRQLFRAHFEELFATATTENTV